MRRRTWPPPLATHGLSLWNAKWTAFRGVAGLSGVELGRETGAEDGFRHVSQHGRAGLTSAIDHYLPIHAERNGAI